MKEKKSRLIRKYIDVDKRLMESSPNNYTFISANVATSNASLVGGPIQAQSYLDSITG